MEEVSADGKGFRLWHEAGKDQTPPADLHVVTSGGQRIPAHSHVLASASPVLESLVYAPPPRSYRDNSERVIRILGVPFDSVIAFIYFMYSSPRTALSLAEGKRLIGEHGVQLLVLAHKYRMGWLKRGCEIELARRLRPESAVDMLKLSRLCDASQLYQRCLRLISQDFSSVQKSDGWRFVQKNDPKLELDILRFVEETEQRRKRWRRQRGDQEMFRELSEAMDCLEHICTEGCSGVGPRHDRAPTSSKGPCSKFHACSSLQMLIRHLASCTKKLSSAEGGASSCPHCKRMLQLFRLHSSLCDRADDSCKVPLCRKFKLKAQLQVEGKKKGDEATWRLLVKKVAVVRVMCSLAKRERPVQQIHQLRARSYRCIR